MRSALLQSGRWSAIGHAVEEFLHAERDQLALWLPVVFGIGIAAWFVLDGAAQWQAWLVAMAAVAWGSMVLPPGSRLRRVVLVSALAMALGCAAIWARAAALAGPVLVRPTVVAFIARIERVEVQTAKQRVRLTLAPDQAPRLPPRVRVTVDNVVASGRFLVGDRVSLRARLVGPPNASIPGGFDFSRVAWFQSLGATGKAIGPVTQLGADDGRTASLREQLSAHIRTRLAGSAGGIASAFATGDRGGISQEDEDAMRSSGLTHLLSVSGLHVTAVVGAAIFLSLRLLALSSTLALRVPLLIISALIGALAGIGYTLLTGAEVPTVRSCIAAVLVLAGIALGREAFTLRLVATGAIVVLMLWPEALIGPSFQLSFAAITSIVALHDTPIMRRLNAYESDGIFDRFGRAVLMLLITGIIVEAALAPIALFHFHRSGLYGALANIVAIPLTTFVIMPLEALALLFDTIGISAPFWWATGVGMEILLGLARFVASVPGAQAGLASVPSGAFGLIIMGGLWLMLWRGPVRLGGILPVTAGVVWALLTPPPDVLITGDGAHMAVRSENGEVSTLRPRAGDYVRSMLGERAGMIGDLTDLDTLPGANCSTDTCRVTLRRSGKTWRILATRSRYLVSYAEFRAECAAADIVVSDRRLPDWCAPRWFKADRVMLAKTGGMSVTFGSGRVETVADDEGYHPWVIARMTASP